MKTMFALGILIALVWLGLLNCPMRTDRGYHYTLRIVNGEELSADAAIFIPSGAIFADEDHQAVVYDAKQGRVVGSGDLTTVCAAMHSDGQQCESDGKGGYIPRDIAHDATPTRGSSDTSDQWMRAVIKEQENYSTAYLPGASMQDLSTGRNITPNRESTYQSPMQDGWFDRVSRLRDAND